MAILNIPIAKAGKGVTMAVDTEIFNDLMNGSESERETALRIVEEGFKTILNSRMGKTILAPSTLEGQAFEDNKAKALAQAEKNLEDIKASKLAKKATSAKAAGVDRAVITRATLLAKDVVKNEIRKAGKKIGLVPPRDITAAAKAMVEANPQFIEDAKALLAEQAKIQSPIDISSYIKESPKLIAEAEARKAERKEQLSKTQAGKPEKRAVKVPPSRPKAEVRPTAH